MSTLRDVARAAGVSDSTVSIVVNGHEKERKISDATVKRVKNAITALNYRPNRSARNLKYEKVSLPEFILFWPDDNRISNLPPVLKGLYKTIKHQKLKTHITVSLFHSGHLLYNLTQLNSIDFQGIIIGGCSLKDMKDLESFKSTVPVVLINRETKRFNSVITDSQQLAHLALNQFKQRQASEISIVSLTNRFIASNIRIKKFKDLTRKNKIKTPKKYQFESDNSYEGGIEIGQQYDLKKHFPKYIFVESDIVALGIIKAFSEKGLKPKKDYFLLTISSLDQDQILYNNPSLSVIEVPAQSITAEIINILNVPKDKPQHLVIEPRLILRETF